MNLDIDKQEKYVVLKLREEKLNGLISPDLKANFVLLNQQEHRNIILDLSETQYCDSSGLSAILIGNRLCKNSGGSLIIAGVQDHIKKLIAISQLDNILLTTPTVSEASDFILMEEVERQLHKEQ